MDDFKRMGGEQSPLMMAISCLCALSILGGVITYVVYLGIYGYNNPDPALCYWSEGLTHSYADEALATMDAISV